jgi:hypothetical protein
MTKRSGINANYEHKYFTTRPAIHGFDHGKKKFYTKRKLFHMTGALPLVSDTTS